MHDSVGQSSRHRLAFMIPMILFVLFFVICCGTLAGLFVRSAGISAVTGQKNDAVQISRNLAERIRAGESVPQREYFDETYRTAEPENAKYYAEFAVQTEDCPKGKMENVEIRVYSMENIPLYTLHMSRYLPDERG